MKTACVYSKGGWTNGIFSILYNSEISEVSLFNQIFIKSYEIFKLSKVTIQDALITWNDDARSRIISLQQIFFGAGQGTRNKTVDYDQAPAGGWEVGPGDTKGNLIFQAFFRWWLWCFMFTPIWGRFPIWLIFFRWVDSTNQFLLLY